MADLSLITYNLCFSKAVKTISTVLKQYTPDIICLQEVETAQEYLQKLTLPDYKLADFSNSFIKFSKVFGLVTFYNPKTLQLLEATSFDIPRGFIEVVVTILRGFNNPRTVLKTKFLHLPTNKTITVYNVHLSPLSMTNKTRIRQIQEMFTDLSISSDDYTLIAGDFNYPYGRKKFELLIETYGLKEATYQLPFTSRGIYHLFFLKLKSDYILYRNLDLINTEKINYNESDHYPIFSKFNI